MKIFIGLIVVILLLFGAFTWFTLTWSYAEGERAGYIQKFSRKGWVCKTWEGEIAMVTMPGTVAEKFAFTVWDDAVAAQINADVAQRVALSYKQHKWIPSSCFGDTEYFVYRVRVAEPAAQLAPAPVAPAPVAPAPVAPAPPAPAAPAPAPEAH